MGLDRSLGRTDKGGGYAAVVDSGWALLSLGALPCHAPEM